MKRVNVLKYCSLFVLGLLVLLGVSACGHKGGGYHTDMMYNMVAYKLDFNDEQEAKLAQIRQQMELIREETHQQRLAKRDEMIAIIESDQLDTARLMQLVQERKDAMSEYAPRLLPLLEELHASLSPEQKEKMVDFMSRHFNR